jgi:hypothetical protein
MAEIKNQTATPPAATQHTLTPRPDPTPDSWYITRRDAILEGDAGTLPSGDTCADQRTEYADLAVEETTPAQATLDSINPAAGTVGMADFALQATGTNFAADSVVVFNATPLATTFVSVTELSGAVIGATLAAGAVPVLVRRPGSPDSAPLNFTVT